MFLLYITVLLLDGVIKDDNGCGITVAANDLRNKGQKVKSKRSEVD